MNILVFNGGLSNKNTKKISRTFYNLLLLRAVGHKVTFLDTTISDCVNCQSCSSGVCVIDDELTTILKRDRFDCIVIATPVYFYHMTAKAKAFLDRLYCLDKENLIFSLLCVSGSPIEESGVDLIEESMLRACEYCNSYLTSSFYKVTDDKDLPVTSYDLVKMIRVIEDMEGIYNEIKKSKI